jgi:hypothetical protein
MPTVKSAFNTRKKISVTQQSLFNVNLVRATCHSTFNVLQRHQGELNGQLSGATVDTAFNTLKHVSASLTVEFNVGMPVQQGIRLIPAARWIPMYPS